MTLAETLKIVRGAVAKKDLVPVLTHLRIKSGWATATNGKLTISAPVDLPTDMDMVVPADKFIRAVQACTAPKMRTTDGGRLSVTCNKSRVLMQLLENVTFPTPQLSGQRYDASTLLVKAEKLLPFVGDDASRPWSCGILLHKGMAYATNNVLLCRTEVDWNGPTVNLPNFLIDEILRLRRKPLHAYTDGGRITLQLEDDVWINSVLLATGWPNADALFKGVNFSALEIVPKELLEAVSFLLPFCPDKKFPRILFTENSVCTDDGVHQASVDFKGLAPSAWRAEPLMTMLDTPADLAANFSYWPKPCPWIRDDGIEGLIMGVRT